MAHNRLPVPFPTVISVDVLKSCLLQIFPEGTAQRGYVTREISAKTIFVLLYAGAIAGSGRWVRPDQVTKMNDLQGAKIREDERRAWTAKSLAPGKMKEVPNRWYAVNTREPIRDETLRNGLVPLGAVVERPDIPTTSSLPRYALAQSFSELLEAFANKTADRQRLLKLWQTAHLTSEARARVHLVKKGAVAGQNTGLIKVNFPNGETRRLQPGPSAVITKAVVEVFSKKFLLQAAVLFISESGAKVIARDDELARQLGLNIEADRNLPDIILVDVFPSRSKLIFVEVVASDGAITAQKQEAFRSLATKAHFDPESVFYVTAFHDRTSPPFKKNVSELAWGSFAWFVSEPEHLVAFNRNAQLK